MRRLTNSEKRKLRKKIKVNNTEEGILLDRILSSINSELNRKLKNIETLEDLEIALSRISFKNLNKLAQRYSKEVLRKNRSGYEQIIEAMTNTLTNTAIKRKREKAFSRAINNLSKEERIFSPLLEQFTYNMSKIKDIPKGVFNTLRKAYFRGEGFRGSDAERIIKEKMGSRAKTIIRTESSKLNSSLIELRSKSIGVKGYYWYSSNDSRVRSSHNLMNNLVVFWNDPPKIDGEFYHAGNIYNCRCVPFPIIQLEDIKFPVKIAQHIVIESKYDKNSKQTISRITGGKILTYTKQQFLKVYGNMFLENG